MKTAGVHRHGINKMRAPSAFAERKRPPAVSGQQLVLQGVSEKRLGSQGLSQLTEMALQVNLAVVLDRDQESLRALIAPEAERRLSRVDHRSNHGCGRLLDEAEDISSGTELLGEAFDARLVQGNIPFVHQHIF